MGSDVRAYSGTPPLGVFGASGGTPLVIDETLQSQRAYFVNKLGARMDLFAASNEVLISFQNDGVALTKGEVVGLDYVGGVTTSDVVAYVANGTVPVLNILGVAREDTAIAAESQVVALGRVTNIDTTGTPVGEVWAANDILYANPSYPGKLTRNKPTAPNVCIPMALLLYVHATQGVIYVRTTVEQERHYGAFSSNATQTAALANTAYAVTFNSTTAARGVSLSGGNTLTIAESGLYEVSVSLQAQSSSASVKQLWFWFRRNGADIANSATQVTVSGSGSAAAPSATVPFIFQNGDTLQVMWAVDSTALTLAAIAAAGPVPACPSAFVTLVQTAL